MPFGIFGTMSYTNNDKHYYTHYQNNKHYGKEQRKHQHKHPEPDKESNIKITWTIDKTTADALKTYATEQAKQNEQNNWTEMPYAFCKWYTKIETNIQNAEIYKKDWENPINYIVIQKDESWNISSITKWQLLNGESVNDNTRTIQFNTDSAKIYKLWTWEQATSIVENNYTQQ